MAQFDEHLAYNIGMCHFVIQMFVCGYNTFPCVDQGGGGGLLIYGSLCGSLFYCLFWSARLLTDLIHKCLFNTKGPTLLTFIDTSGVMNYAETDTPFRFALFKCFIHRWSHKILSLISNCEWEGRKLLGLTLFV